jgi:hypothetical protein
VTGRIVHVRRDSWDMLVRAVRVGQKPRSPLDHQVVRMFLWFDIAAALRLTAARASRR